MKYRKKPIVIDAVKWDGRPETANEFLGERFGTDWLYAGVGSLAIMIWTREGLMRGEVGDWIIRGVAGEFYPIKADIFEATYELAETLEGVP